MPALNEKESAVFELLRESVDRDGIVPSIREICVKLGFASTSTAHRCLNSLEEKGLIVRTPGQNRSIRLERAPTAQIPLVGTVAAGQPLLATQSIEGYLPRAGDARDLFALRVRGESMINIGILRDDLIIVQRTSTAHDGEIIVALIDDEATVKRFFREPGGQYRLQPENDTMQPIITDHVLILGRVIELRRDFI